MSGFQKIEKSFWGSLDDITSQLENVYSVELSKIFNGFEVELKTIPAGNGYSYFRCVKGKIAGVRFWLSNPEYERPLPLCEFEVIGEDQFGVKFEGFVNERQFITQIPWQNFVPPGEFMVIQAGGTDHGGNV